MFLCCEVSQTECSKELNLVSARVMLFSLGWGQEPSTRILQIRAYPLSPESNLSCRNLCRQSDYCFFQRHLLFLTSYEPPKVSSEAHNFFGNQILSNDDNITFQRKQRKHSSWSKPSPTTKQWNKVWSSNGKNVNPRKSTHQRGGGNLKVFNSDLCFAIFHASTLII